jgi:hypothetical protein
MAEIAFEVMAVALEGTRGTEETPPTHRLNMAGTLTPTEEIYYPPDQVGDLAEYQRSEIVRKSGEYEASGGADVYTLPVLLNMALAPVSTGVTAGGEVTGTTVTAAGSGYSAGATVTVSAPAAGGRQAVMTATVVAGALTAVNIIDPGRGYSAAPTLTIVPVSGGTLATATATVSALATTAKIFEFVRVVTADTVKSATAFWGDPNQALYEGIFTMLTELGLTGDASGTDGVMQSVKGISQFPEEILSGSIPTIPDANVGPLLVPGRMQVWMESDTSNRFGKTEVTGRVVSADLTAPTGVVPKYVATGPEGEVTYDHVGRTKTHPEAAVVVEMVDQDQYDLYKNGTTVKMRVRYNGGLIEAGFYYFVEFDIRGKLSAMKWGELAGANRTMEFSILGEKDAEIASDLRVRVQTDTAVL